MQAWAKKQADQAALRNGATVCISFPNGKELGAPVQVEVTSTTNWFPILKLKVTKTAVKSMADMRLEAQPTKYSAGCA